MKKGKKFPGAKTRGMELFEAEDAGGEHPIRLKDIPKFFAEYKRAIKWICGLEYPGAIVLDVDCQTIEIRGISGVDGSLQPVVIFGDVDHGHLPLDFLGGSNKWFTYVIGELHAVIEAQITALETPKLRRDDVRTCLKTIRCYSEAISILNYPLRSGWKKMAKR